MCVKVPKPVLGQVRKSGCGSQTVLGPFCYLFTGSQLFVQENKQERKYDSEKSRQLLYYATLAAILSIAHRYEYYLACVDAILGSHGQTRICRSLLDFRPKLTESSTRRATHDADRSDGRSKHESTWWYVAHLMKPCSAAGGYEKELFAPKTVKKTSF